MHKCFTCNRTIKNPYFLDGKVYGYNCYKMALSLKLAHLQELKNDEYARKCTALISIFSSKKFTKQWNIGFQKSILRQWNDCKKLTGKQFSCIVKKLNEVEYLDYMLTFYEINRDFTEIGVTAEKNGIDSLLKSDMLKIFKNDERLHDFIRDYRSRRIARGKKYYIVESRDTEETDSIYIIMSNNQLEELQNDEYIKILEIISL